MRAGDLRHRITLQQRSTVTDSLGGHSDKWTSVLTVWAHIQPMSGRELLAAQAVRSETTHAIILRFHPMLSNPIEVSKMRVLYGTRIFNITGCVNQDERNRIIELSAFEGMNQG